MISDGLILGLVFSGVLTLLAYRVQSLPIGFVAALGWMASGLLIQQQTSEIIPTVLAMMIAVATFMAVPNARKG